MKKNLKHLLSKGAAIVFTAAMTITSLAGLDFTSAKAAENDVVQDLASFDDVSADKVAEVMSPGWNLGNQLEAGKIKDVDGVTYCYPDETAYGNPVITRGTFKAVKEAGFKSVRIPVSYLDYIGDEASGYKVDETWLSRVKEVVDMALEEGLYAVINMHQDGYNTVTSAWLLCNADASQQPAIKAKYGAAWTQIAQYFADYDEHLMFESMNEEFDGVTYDADKISKEYYQNINDYNQVFVDSVRQAGGNNDARWLIVCGWNTDIEFTTNSSLGFAMPTDTHKKAGISDSRIMVSVHDYEPWGFCGGEDGNTTQWGSYTTTSTLTAATFENAMAVAFNKLRDTFTSKGIPVFIGEYGAIDKTEDDADSLKYVAYFDQKICENSKRIGAVPMLWDNGYNGKYGFGVFDRTKSSDTTNAAVTKPDVIKAIVDVYAETETSNSATKISLDKTSASAGKSESIQLSASLTPADAADAITWSSSDEAVATVNQSGLVKVLDDGECDIVASLPNGEKAVCKVTGENSGLACQWYASNTKSWSVASSEILYIQDGEAKKYTSTIPMSRESICNIGALYLKDMNAEAGINKTSPIEYCHVTVNSFKVNGVSIPLVQNEDIDAINEFSVLDMLIINKWNAEKEMIANMPTVGNVAGESRTFEGYPGVTLQDSNVIEIEFETLAKGSSSENNGSDEEKPETVKTATVKNVKYKITSSSKKTAAVTGVSKNSLTSANVASTVKIGGKTYKVTAINANAFKGCKKLASVTIGKNVTTIGKNAFNGCAKLKKITVNSTKITSVKSNAFKGIHAKCKITVPKAKYTKYSKLFKGKGQKSTVTIVKK